MQALKEVLEYRIIDLSQFQLTAYHLIIVLAIFLFTRLLLWIIRKILERGPAGEKLDKGRRFALFTIIKYFIFVLAAVLVMETMGFDVTILVAGSAALLVGIGFGVQQLFNDFVSGLLLLFEGTIQIADIIEVDGLVGKVINIGLRTTEIETRESIVIIVPNSKLTAEKVINWSHNKQLTRFKVLVGVSYDSDIGLVEQIMLDAAKEQPEISNERVPEVRITDYADSALNFELLFWSHGMFYIERTKSNLRKHVLNQFREQGVTIPFPQRDVHMK